MISLLSERLHYYETRMEDVTLKGVPARLASLILFLVESEGVQVPGEIRIPTRYTHEHLGTMIGANREVVTRAFGRLQEEGLCSSGVASSTSMTSKPSRGRPGAPWRKQEGRAPPPRRRLKSSALPGRLAP